MTDKIVFDARVALREANWEVLMPELVVCAERVLKRVGWQTGRNTQPRGFEIEELISEAVARVLKGDRNWNRAAPVNLVGFLSNVMRSVCGHERDKLADEVPDSDRVADEAAAPVSEGHDGYGDEFAGRLAEAIGNDEDLEYYKLAVEEVGPKRSDIAEALGWPAEKVSVVKKKFRRRLEAAMKQGDKVKACYDK